MKTKMILLFILFFNTLSNLHKENAHVFFTIGGDGSQEYRSYAAILAAVFWKSSVKSNRGENLQR